MPLSFEHMRAVPFVMRRAASLRIHLVGCGGTGSWLAPALVRLTKHHGAALTFQDHDHVEEANCMRQNFCLAEVGRNKAVTLARRYGSAWGMAIEAVPQAFGASSATVRPHVDETVLYIGCVDNAAARCAIESQCAEHAPHPYGQAPPYWLDCGNTALARGANTAQVVLGSARTLDALSGAFGVPTFCTALPSTTLLHPNLRLAEHEDSTTDGSEELSCEELALRNMQGMTINQHVAAIAAEYVNQLLAGTLKRFATYIDTASGTTHALPISPQSVVEALSGLRSLQRRSLLRRMANGTAIQAREHRAGNAEF